jgi:hypothetical protein
VSGTWELDGDRLRVAWFREAGRPPRRLLAAEVATLSSLLDADLRLAVTVV